MNSNPHRAIIVIGGEDPAEPTLMEAQRYDEVFVLARAVADPNDRWLVDDDRSHARANARLARALARLRTLGVRAFGMVGDENATAAQNDARAIVPTAEAILS